MTWEQQLLRKATRASQMRGLADLEKFGNVAGEVVFPLADESQATRYIIWSIMLRDPSLDASTVRNYCNGISAAHEALRAALRRGHDVRVASVMRTLLRAPKGSKTLSCRVGKPMPLLRKRRKGSKAPREDAVASGR